MDARGGAGLNARRGLPAGQDPAHLLRDRGRARNEQTLALIDIARLRLRAQRLAGEPFASPVEAVGWFGGVQAQDYLGAKWAVGQRTAGASDAGLDRLFDEGRILRTHVMRPTWHFVAPEDVGWLQELTSSRVLAGMSARFRQLELDRLTLDRAVELFADALAGGRHLTRAELGEVLTRAGISAEGQRLAHLLAAAEHANVVTSGPRRGKQFTYALLVERAPRMVSLPREEALAELTRRYFRSHGPAQEIDFSWWSGLTRADARRGIDVARSELEEATVEGKRYWWAPATGASDGPQVHLLPNFDELTVAYRDRSALLDPALAFDGSRFSWFREQSPESGILSNVVLAGGRVLGSWKRTLSRGRLDVQLRLLTPLSPGQETALDDAVGRYANFLGALTGGVVREPAPA